MSFGEGHPGVNARKIVAEGILAKDNPALVRLSGLPGFLGESRPSPWRDYVYGLAPWTGFGKGRMF
jgi:hypothetical protein